MVITQSSSSSERTELLPCPFCGWAPDIAHDEHAAEIFCPNEECIGTKSVSYAESLETVTPLEHAIAAWNRRPSINPTSATDLGEVMEGQTAEQYRDMHDAAIAAYEAATPADYRYSAAALRNAVDAALSCLTPRSDHSAKQPEKCEGQLCYYHGCQYLDGCAHRSTASVAALSSAPTAGEVETSRGVETEGAWEKEVLAVMVKHLSPKTLEALTYEHGPYSITKVRNEIMTFASALRLAASPAQPVQEMHELEPVAEPDGMDHDREAGRTAGARSPVRG